MHRRINFYFVWPLILSSFCLWSTLGKAAESHPLPPVVQSEGAHFIPVDDQWIDLDYFAEGFKKDSSGLWAMGGQPQKVHLWPDGVLPLKFRKNVSSSLQKMIWNACAEWSQAANVRCVYGKYKGAQLVIGRSFVGIKTGCWSMLGYGRYFAGIRRRMNLGPGCDDSRIVLHEMGHAFGLTHEHQRSDRDEYIKILKENTDPGFLGFGFKLNFAKQSTNNLTPYDFFSIMHYGRRAASRNGLDTIVPKAPNEEMINVIGKSAHLSIEDKKSIAALYGPPR